MTTAATSPTDLDALAFDADADVLPGGPWPWDRLPGESRQAFTAFQAFLSQSQETRTQRTVCARLYPASAKRGNRVASRVGHWSSRYRWMERAKSWDAVRWRSRLFDLLGPPPGSEELPW